MTYDDLVVFLCRSFPSRHRERELLTRFHSLRIRRHQTIDDYMAEAKSLRDQLSRTSHVTSDATMMTQIMIGLQPSKALSAALEAALIDTRRVNDWTLTEFETQVKALGDVHHVPPAKSKPDAVASLQAQGLSKRDAETAAATLAAGGAGRGQWGQFRKSGQKGKGKNPKGKPGKPGKASKPDQQSDWTAGQNRWGKGQKGARSGWQGRSYGRNQHHQATGQVPSNFQKKWPARGEFKRRFLDASGTESGWAKRQGLNLAQVGPEHHDLFATDAVWSDDLQADIPVCLRCQSYGHTAAHCGESAQENQRLADA